MMERCGEIEFLLSPFNHLFYLRRSLEVAEGRIQGGVPILT